MLHVFVSFLAIAGTSAGVGFAIPSSTVLRIVPQLIQFGKVSVSWNQNMQKECSKSSTLLWYPY